MGHLSSLQSPICRATYLFLSGFEGSGPTGLLGNHYTFCLFSPLFFSLHLLPIFLPLLSLFSLPPVWWLSIHLSSPFPFGILMRYRTLNCTHSPVQGCSWIKSTSSSFSSPSPLFLTCFCLLPSFSLLLILLLSHPICAPFSLFFFF